MKKLIAFIASICIVASFVGCTRKVDSQVTDKNVVAQESNLTSLDVKNTLQFTELLVRSGYKIKTTKEDKKGILNGTLTNVNIDGENISVYEYKDNQSMEQDAKTIGTDGSMIGNTIYDFKSKPHFYKKGTIIVSYIGDNKETLNKIEKIMGGQFAGVI